MSENPIESLFHKAKVYGYEYELTKDEGGQWQINLSKNQQNSWQIKQNNKSNEWVIFLLGKPQLLLSTNQMLGFLEKYIQE